MSLLLHRPCLRFNYQTRVYEITGRMFPCWVMLSTTPIGAASLDQARAQSVFRRRLTKEQHETTIVLPSIVTARFVGLAQETLLPAVGLWSRCHRPRHPPPRTCTPRSIDVAERRLSLLSVPGGIVCCG